MIKTIASLFALYVSTNSQVPPMIPPAIPAVTVPPQPPAATTQATPVIPPPPPNVVIPPQAVTPATPQSTIQRLTPQPSIPQSTTSAPVAIVPPQPQTTSSIGNPQFIPIVPQTTAPVAPSITAAPIVTQPLTPPGKYFGVYGQLCPIPEPDAMCQPNAPSFGAAMTEQVVGFAKCERNGDCCGCASISCGSEWNGCNTFSAGNNGAMGVQSISVIGRSEQNGGGQIQCLGIEACANAVITGSNIKSIDADKTGSMRNAKVTLSSVVADFDLNCIGLLCHFVLLNVLYE